MKSFLAIIYIFLVGVTLQAQSNFPHFFDDYHLVIDTDSLESVVYQMPTNSDNYLYQLIALEMSRNVFSEKLGTDFNKIEKLLLKENKNACCYAMYSYLKGAKFSKKNLDLAASNFIEASKVFEQQKDTVGLLACYAYLIKVNLGVFYYENFRGDFNIAAGYYDKIQVLAGNCHRPWAKMIGLNSIVMYSQELEKANWDAQLNAYQKAWQLSISVPKLSYYQINLNNNIGRLYSAKGDYENQFNYQFKAYNLLKNKNTELAALLLANLGGACYNKASYIEAEKYYKMSIETHTKCGIVYNNVLKNAYITLAGIQHVLHKYDMSWANTLKYMTIRDSVEKNAKIQGLLDVQTKYETEKKELDNQRLRVEQKLILGFAGLLASMLAILLYAYLKNQQKKKELERLNLLIASQIEDLRFSNKRMTFFTRTLSHDTMNYLDNIINHSVLSQNIDHDPEIMQSIITVIHRNAIRLKKMAENLIVFNKVTFVQRLEVIRLKNIIEEVIEDTNFDFTPPNSLTLPTEEIDRLLIKGNREFMKQVFRNLVDNSLKFRKPNNPFELQISLEILPENNRIKVSVTDNGIGISKHKCETIFKEFDQENSLTMGSGLGLYISQQIIENMGGSIAVTSEKNIGSTFFFTLPYQAMK